ncbi:MAG: hypothetical protein KC635_29315, partial [Myxococcales bacterium]|nr:hypothetical protein [Myxococcales bacterium]
DAFACQATRAMAKIDGASWRADALVERDGTAWLVRSEYGSALTVTTVGLDGSLGATALPLDDASNYTSEAFAAATGAGLAVVWKRSLQTGAEELRFAVAKADLSGFVVAAVTVPTAASDYLRAPQVVAEGDGYGLFYVATTISGTTGAWFQRVDGAGAAVGQPVSLASGATGLEAVAAPGGGFVAAWSVGDYTGSEVFFARLDAAGAGASGAVRVSRVGGDGRRSNLGARAAGRAIAPLADGRTLVAYTEAWSNDDFADPQGYGVARVAVVGGDGAVESFPIAEPVNDETDAWPSFVDVDGALGLMWVHGGLIYICAGCITDYDLHLVMLDTARMLPASAVATLVHPGQNGINAPLAVTVGGGLLTFASLDFHALSYPASGELACYPAL